MEEPQTEERTESWVLEQNGWGAEPAPNSERDLTATESFIARGRAHGATGKKTIPMAMGEAMQAHLSTATAGGAFPGRARPRLQSGATEGTPDSINLGETHPQADFAKMKFNIDKLLGSASGASSRRPSLTPTPSGTPRASLGVPHAALRAPAGRGSVPNTPRGAGRGSVPNTPRGAGRGSVPNTPRGGAGRGSVPNSPGLGPSGRQTPMRSSSFRASPSMSTSTQPLQQLGRGRGATVRSQTPPPPTQGRSAPPGPAAQTRSASRSGDSLDAPAPAARAQTPTPQMLSTAGLSVGAKPAVPKDTRRVSLMSADGIVVARAASYSGDGKALKGRGRPPPSPTLLKAGEQRARSRTTLDDPREKSMVGSLVASQVPSPTVGPRSVSGMPPSPVRFDSGPKTEIRRVVSNLRSDSSASVHATTPLAQGSVLGRRDDSVNSEQMGDNSRMFIGLQRVMSSPKHTLHDLAGIAAESTGEAMEISRRESRVSVSSRVRFNGSFRGGGGSVRGDSVDSPLVGDQVRRQMAMDDNIGAVDAFTDLGSDTYSEGMARMPVSNVSICSVNQANTLLTALHDSAKSYMKRARTASMRRNEQAAIQEDSAAVVVGLAASVAVNACPTGAGGKEDEPQQAGSEGTGPAADQEPALFLDRIPQPTPEEWTPSVHPKSPPFIQRPETRDAETQHTPDESRCTTPVAHTEHTGTPHAASPLSEADGRKLDEQLRALTGRVEQLYSMTSRNAEQLHAATQQMQTIAEEKEKEKDATAAESTDRTDDTAKKVKREKKDKRERRRKSRSPTRRRRRRRDGRDSEADTGQTCSDSESQRETRRSARRLRDRGHAVEPLRRKGSPKRERVQDRNDFSLLQSPGDAYQQQYQETLRNLNFDSMTLWSDFMARGPHPQQHTAADLVGYCLSLDYTRVEAFCLAALWANTNKRPGGGALGSPERFNRSTLGGSRHVDVSSSVYVDDSTAANTPLDGPTSPNGNGVPLPPLSPGVHLDVHGPRSPIHLQSSNGTLSYQTVPDAQGTGFYPLGDGAGYQEVRPDSTLFHQISLEVVKSCYGVNFVRGERFRVARIVEGKCNDAVTRQFLQRKRDKGTKVLYYNTPKMKSFLAAVMEGLPGDGVFSTSAVVRETPPPGKFLSLFLCEAAVGRSKLTLLKKPSSRKELLRAGTLRGSKCDSVKTIYPIHFKNGSVQQGCHYCTGAALPRYLVQLEVVKDSRPHPERFRVRVRDMSYLDGTYTEVEGKPCREMPLYANGRCRLFNDSRQGWMFCVGADGPEKDEGIVTSDGMHGGGLPHQMKGWKRSDGQQWVDADVEIVPDDMLEVPAGYYSTTPATPVTHASTGGATNSDAERKAPHRNLCSYGNPIAGYGMWEWRFGITGCEGKVAFGIGHGEWIHAEVGGPGRATATLRLLLTKTAATFRLFKLNDAYTPQQVYIPLWAPSQLVFPQVSFAGRGSATMLDAPRQIALPNELPA